MIAQDAAGRVDPALIAAWLTARSIARDLPKPIPDRGGFRVDTQSVEEVRRWVFPTLTAGLSELAHEIFAPDHFLKLCGTGEQLTSVAPARWALQPTGYVMTAGEVASGGPVRLPSGYRLESNSANGKIYARIVAPDGGVAASGYAVETPDVFIYDRVETAPRYRRTGLGRALTKALDAARKSSATARILVASEDGRKLYASLGWSVYSPYATIGIPELR